MSKCKNCGRDSHCGTPLHGVAEGFISEKYGDGKTIKICDHCCCDECMENENTYSDERVCTIEDHYFSAPWVVYFRDLGIDWVTGKPFNVKNT